MKNIKEYNLIRVFKTLKQEGPLSRAALAKRLKLSRPAVTNITQRLIEMDFLVEVGKGISTDKGGRKEVLLSVNPESIYILAIDIEREFYIVSLINIHSEVIDKEESFFNIHSKPELILEQTVISIKKIMERNRIKRECILGIGISIPGIIDYDNGLVKEVFALNLWKKFPLKKYFEDRLNYPVFVENNIKALTIAEYKQGKAKEYNDLVVLSIGDGIGAGIIVSGQLIRGFTSSAGEIGYEENMPFGIDKYQLLAREDIKDWGDILSHSNLLIGMKKGLQLRLDSVLKEDSKIIDIAKAADEGDFLARYLLDCMGELLGIVGYSLILTINPPILILNGLLFRESKYFFYRVRDKILKGILKTPIERIEIKVSALSDTEKTVGMAELIFEDFFSIPELKNKSLTRTVFMGVNKGE